MSEVLFNKVAVVGVGLIGGSFALELKDKGLCNSVVGIGRTLPNLEKAKQLNIVDSFTQDIVEGVKDADLIFFSVPVLTIPTLLEQIKNNLKDGVIITDGGSVKTDIVVSADEILGNVSNVNFVGGHPIAGTEKSGAESAFLGLYKDKACILTPTGNTDNDSLQKIKKTWELIGSKVIVMNAPKHDKLLAAISHLPHMIAYCLVNTVADLESLDNDILKYSAGGFKDFTRIASSPAEMWTDICIQNKDNIIEMIEDFQVRLEDLKNHIASGHIEEISKKMTKAKQMRDSLVDK